MRQYLAAAAALALVSCGGQGDSNEAAGEKPAEGGGGAAASLQPGQWEITTQVVSMNVPNMPQGMNVPLPGPTTVRSCMTPEQASRPSADFFTGSGQNSGCTYENQSMSGGRLQATVQCESGDTTMRSTMEGQFSATSFELNQRIETTAQGTTTQMESRTSGRRVGDCPA